MNNKPGPKKQDSVRVQVIMTPKQQSDVYAIARVRMCSFSQVIRDLISKHIKSTS